MLNYLLCKFLDFLNAVFDVMLNLSNYLTAAFFGIIVFFIAAALRFSTCVVIYNEGIYLSDKLIAMNAFTGFMWLLFAVFSIYCDRWLILHKLKDMKKVRIASLIFAIACFIKAVTIAIFMVNYVENIQLMVAVNYVIEIVAWICGGVFLVLLHYNIESIQNFFE